MARKIVVVGSINMDLVCRCARMPGLGETVAGLRAVAHAAGGHAVVLTAPEAVRDGLDLWGPVPGLELMRRVKEQFDPAGRFAPGSFVGGI